MSALLGAGTVINPIIKIVTTVAILGAVYLFIVKPVLETTDNVVDRSFDAFGDVQGLDQLPQQVQGQVDEALERTDDSQRLQDCIQRAIRESPPDQRQVNRCVDRFGS